MQALLLTTGASFALSVLGAILADTYLTERIPVFGDFLGLQYSVNPGIAWGIQLPNGFQEILIIVALITVAVLAIRSTKTHSLSPIPYSLPFGLILGGGLANVVDRLRDGVVTDYFQIGSFPIFNVADSCVTVGVLLLLLDFARIRKKSAGCPL